MIDASKHDFPSLYLEIAKLKPQDRKHLMMCLSNRKRVLEKELRLHAAKQMESRSNDTTIIP